MYPKTLRKEKSNGNKRKALIYILKKRKNKAFGSILDYIPPEILIPAGIDYPLFPFVVCHKQLTRTLHPP